MPRQEQQTGLSQDSIRERAHSQVEGEALAEALHFLLETRAWLKKQREEKWLDPLTACEDCIQTVKDKVRRKIG